MAVALRAPCLIFGVSLSFVLSIRWDEIFHVVGTSILMVICSSWCNAVPTFLGRVVVSFFYRRRAAA